MTTKKRTTKKGTRTLATVTPIQPAVRADDHANLQVPIDVDANADPLGNEGWARCCHLWCLLRDHLIDIFEHHREELTAADLNVCRQFLKDNSCAMDQAHRVPLGKGLRALEGVELPFGKH